MTKRYTEKDKTILYHGSSELFDSFEKDEIKNLGFHFGTLTAAQRRAENIYVCETMFSTPCELKDIPDMDWRPIVILQQLFPEGWKEKFQELRPLGYPEQYQRIQDYLDSQGFDCVSYTNLVEDPGSISYILWDISKIKILKRLLL